MRKSTGASGSQDASPGVTGLFAAPPVCHSAAGSDGQAGFLVFVLPASRANKDASSSVRCNRSIWVCSLKARASKLRVVLLPTNVPGGHRGFARAGMEPHDGRHLPRLPRLCPLSPTGTGLSRPDCSARCLTSWKAQTQRKWWTSSRPSNLCAKPGPGCCPRS